MLPSSQSPISFESTLYVLRRGHAGVDRDNTLD